MFRQRVIDQLRPLQAIYDRHRVLVLSVGNAAGIFGMACLIAMAVIGIDPAREVAAASARAGSEATSASPAPPAPAKAPRVARPSAGPAPSATAGHRDYEVEVRTPAPRRADPRHDAGAPPAPFTQPQPVARQRLEDDGDDGPILLRE